MSKQDTGRGRHGTSDATTTSVDGSEALETVVARLRADNEGLRTSLRHRAVIEQAKGVLIARTGCTPDQAFERLVRHSQRSNEKLVRVAAAVVGAAVRAVTPVAAVDGFDLTGLFEPSGDGHVPAARRADERLAGVALESALDLQELVQVIAFEAALDLGPEAVLLAALEPDGAVRLVAGVGYDGQMMSAWHRIPPTVDVPLVTAARTNQPVLLPDRDTRVARFPATASIPSAYEAQVSIPMRAGGTVVGVIGMSWPHRRTFDDAEQRRLAAIAEQAVGPFLRLLRSGLEDLPQVAVEVMRTRWFRAALDALLVPSLLLAPVRDVAGTVVDFEVAYVNREALPTDVAPDRIAGRTVLELYPHTAGKRMFAVFCEVLESGTPARLERVPIRELVDGSPTAAEVELSVARLGDGLFVNWRVLDA